MLFQILLCGPDAITTFRVSGRYIVQKYPAPRVCNAFQRQFVTPRLVSEGVVYFRFIGHTVAINTHTHTHFWANLWQLLPEAPVFKHPWELKTRGTRETWLDSPVKHSLLHSYTGLTSKKCFSGWTHQSKWKVKSCYYAVDSPPARTTCVLAVRKRENLLGKFTANRSCKGSEDFGSVSSFKLWREGHLPPRG